MQRIRPTANPEGERSHLNSRVSPTPNNQKEGAMLTRFPTMLKTLAVGALFFLSTSPAWALTQTIIHGHTGHVQNPSAYSSVTPYDWGLNLRLKQGRSDWVHYSIPITNIPFVRYVMIRVYLKDSVIEEVRFRNGVSLVHRSTNPGFVNGWNYKVLDLGGVGRIFPNGLGISIKVRGNHDIEQLGVSPRIIITGLKAYH